jgi:hypothetical protein
MTSPDSRVLHTVVIAWKAGVSDSTLEEIERAVTGLAAQVDGVESFYYGPDAEFFEGNGDYVISAVFADVDAFNAYAAHKAHQQLLEKYLLPNAERHMAAQARI